MICSSYNNKVRLVEHTFYRIFDIIEGDTYIIRINKICDKKVYCDWLAPETRRKYKEFVYYEDSFLLYNNVKMYRVKELSGYFDNDLFVL